MSELAKMSGDVVKHMLPEKATTPAERKRQQ